MARVFFLVTGASRGWLAGILAQLRLGLLRGPFGAAHQSALRASGIAEEGEYARKLTKFYVTVLMIM